MTNARRLATLFGAAVFTLSLAADAGSRPDSRWRANNASLSVVSSDGLLSAFQKLGYATSDTYANESVGGAYDTVSLDIAKGRVSGFAELTRPAGHTRSDVSPLASPAELEKSGGKRKGAYLYDKDADVFLAIELRSGSIADAKALLSLVAKKR